jgi:anti-sigma regulatory factor (Ser/Thr protein kinase)
VNEELVVLGTITLPGVGSSAGHLRLFARDLLGLDHPRLDDIGLCLTEKFSNAIQHTASGSGGGRVTVTLAAGRGVVRTEVTDEGGGGRRPALPAPGDHLPEHGRGLLLLNALSERWGYEPAGPGTTVWADFPMFPGITGR